MAATKKRNAYRGLIAWMLVLLALCALCFAGYLYTRNFLSARAKQNEEDVLKINAERTQEYNAAMAEHQQQSAADKDMQWPAAAASGWDVVDLTAYPVSEGSLTTVTRKEMLEGGLLLINRWHMMPADLTDDMMISISRTSRADEDKNNNIPTTNSSLMLQPVAVNALMKLYGDARAAGLDMDGIIVSEGYRTMEQQTSLWNKKVESLSGSYSGERLNEMAMRSTAYPGTSDYQTGLSVFVYNYKKGDNEFTSTLLHETEQGKWLYQNCWKYGYIFRYPIQGFPYADTVDKSFKTGYTDQMKVYRYVGVANAAAMNTLGMCLEEYIEYLMAHPHIAVYSDGTLKYEIYRMEGGYSDTAVTVPYGAASYSASTDNMDGLIVAITY